MEDRPSGGKLSESHLTAYATKITTHCCTINLWLTMECENPLCRSASSHATLNTNARSQRAKRCPLATRNDLGEAPRSHDSLCENPKSCKSQGMIHDATIKYYQCDMKRYLLSIWLCHYLSDYPIVSQYGLYVTTISSSPTTKVTFSIPLLRMSASRESNHSAHPGWEQWSLREPNALNSISQCACETYWKHEEHDSTSKDERSTIQASTLETFEVVLEGNKVSTRNWISKQKNRWLHNFQEERFCEFGSTCGVRSEPWYQSSYKSWRLAQSSVLGIATKQALVVRVSEQIIQPATWRWRMNISWNLSSNSQEGWPQSWRILLQVILGGTKNCEHYHWRSHIFGNLLHVSASEFPMLKTVCCIPSATPGSPVYNVNAYNMIHSHPWTMAKHQHGGKSRKQFILVIILHYIDKWWVRRLAFVHWERQPYSPILSVFFFKANICPFSMQTISTSGH